MKRALVLAPFALVVTPVEAAPLENPDCILGEVTLKAADWMADMLTNPRDPENEAQRDLADEVVMAALSCTARNGWSDQDLDNAMAYASGSAWNARSLRRLAATGFDVKPLYVVEAHPGFPAFFANVGTVNTMDEVRPAADTLLAGMGIGALTAEQRRHAQDVLISAAFVQFATQEISGQTP